MAAAVQPVVETLEGRTLVSATLLGDAFSVPRGNFNNTNLSMNGAVIGNLPYEPRLDLTNGGVNEANSAFATTAYNVAAFTTDFSFQINNPTDGGLAFVLQGSGPTAVGSSGSGVGYAGIGKSIAVEFTPDATGGHTTLAINGVAGASTSLTTAGGVDLRTGDVFDIQVRYDGSTLSVSETDESTPTSASPAAATQTYANVNIPAAVGGSTAYAGFTGGTGAGAVPRGGGAAASSTDEILNWEFADVPAADADIGAPAVAGGSSFSNGVYTLTAGGTGLGSTSDQFHLAAKSLTGDGTIIAQLNGQTAASGVAGLMLRDGTSAGAAFAFVGVGPGGATFQYRTSAGSSAVVSTGAPAGVSSPVYLKLVRNGPTASGYVSTAGASGPWQLVGAAGFNTSQTLQIGLAAAAGTAAGTEMATFASVSATRDSAVGMDTGAAGANWYEQSQMWTDVMKQASPFVNPTDGVTPVSVDANGFPTADFQTTVLATSPINLGVYHLSMVCNQSPTLFVGNGTVANQVYNAATKTVTADVTLSTPGQNVSIFATSTGGGATAIHFYRPGYDGTSGPFTNVYLNMLREFHPGALRFMNFTAANNNPTGQWSQRTQPTDARQTATLMMTTTTGQPDSRYGLCAKGMAWEYAVMLANAVHSDMWINIPAHADDNYIAQLANLIKNGDTVNGVSFPALAPDLNVYIEFSNETWNPGAEEYSWDVDKANAEVAAGAQQGGTPSNLNYDNLPVTPNGNGGYTNGITWGERYFARRLVQTGHIFASAFGPGSLTTRIRPVLSIINTGEEQDLLNFVSANYGPPSQSLYSVSSVIYMNENGPLNAPNTANGGFTNPNLTEQQVLQNLAANATDPARYYDAIGAIAKPLGLRLEAYEGGIDLTGPEDLGQRQQAVRDPLASGVIEQNIAHWFARGGDLFMYFTAEASRYGNPHGDFQITESVANPTGPKVIGYLGARNAERPLLAPTIPTGLFAKVLSSSQASLTWSDVANDQSMSRIICSTDGKFTSNVIEADVPAGATSYTFAGLQPGIRYFFHVVAAGYAGDSDPSNQASALMFGTALPPSAPTNLTTAAVSNSQVNLTWTDNANTEAGFLIDQSTDPTFASNVTTVNLAPDATSYAVYGLDSNTTYYYRVRSSNLAGNSANSNAAGVTTLAATPAALWHLNEGSGTTVNDSAANPDAGALVNGVAWAPGLNGSGLSFDGQTGYVDLGHPNKITFTGQITVSAWVKPTAVNSTEVDLVSKDNDGQNGPFFLALGGPSAVTFGTYRSAGYGGNIQASGSAPAPLTDGKWHLVLGTYDGAAFKVYVDGALAGTTADPFGTCWGFHSIALGRNSNGNDSTKYYNGVMNEVAIYSAGMSAKDVAALYANGGVAAQPPPAAPSGLTANATSPTQATLTWTDNGGAESGYAFGQSTDGVNWTTATPASPVAAHATTAAIGGLSAGTTYSFRIAAVGPGGTSPFATTASPVTTPQPAPNAPTGLTAVAPSPTQVNLNWTDNGGPETGFVFGESTDNANWTTVAPLSPVAPHATTASIGGLAAGTTYYFRVAATGSGGTSAYATAAPVATPAPPEVIVDNRSPAVTLTGRWWFAGNEPGFFGQDFLNDGGQSRGTKSAQFSPALPSTGQYTVYGYWPASAANASNVPVDILAADGTHTVFINEQATGGQWVFLGAFPFNPTGGGVRVRNAVGSGLVVADAFKFSQAPVPAVPPPSAPTGLNAVVASSSEVDLKWTDTASNETGYKIELSTDGTHWTLAGGAAAGATSFPVTGLSASTSYSFRVKAYNSGGDSSYATAGPVTTLPSTVVVDNDSPGATLTGHWWYSGAEPGFFGKDYLNDGNQLKGTKSVLFTPVLPAAGNYAVYARWPAAAQNDAKVPIDVQAADGIHTVFKNEQTLGNQWVLLGTYAFNAAGAGVTFRTTGTTGLVVADAVEFVSA